MRRRENNVPSGPTLPTGTNPTPVPQRVRNMTPGDPKTNGLYPFSDNRGLEPNPHRRYNPSPHREKSIDQ